LQVSLSTAVQSLRVVYNEKNAADWNWDTLDWEYQKCAHDSEEL